jgi:hypothetical protein
MWKSDSRITSVTDRKAFRRILFLAILIVTVGSLLAQHVPSTDRGDPTYRRKSNLDGNNIRATVFNFGFSGRTAAVPDEYPYEWPKNTDREYVALVAIWMGGEVVDESGQTIQIIDFPTYRQSPQGQSWNMEPVPGFLNPNQSQIARSDDPNSWPASAQGGWRDKQDDLNDPGWVGSWNGFFGKNIFNADQEMFYRCSDDLYNRFNYIPDQTDPSRGGMGLLMDVRAFAWTQILISDVVFYIHDILNDGTKRISKTSFLIWLADIVGGDANDDEPYVDLQTNIAFLTDQDRIGTEPFGNDPVGLASIKFLETPGNQVDGIDNDGDADRFPALLNGINGDPAVRVPAFTEADFDPRSVGPGDKIVLIDSATFERRIVEYPQGGGVVKSLGKEYVLPPGGIALVEDTLADQFDDDLDGLIDERATLHLERFDDFFGTEKPVRYINYLSFDIGDTVKRGFVVAGESAEQNYENVAPMIDESRDDFFDNDNDWNPLEDDVGLDGVEGTGDTGEGDGLPTSGSGTGFPGEKNIDKTDVSETDVIGITSAIQDPAFNINFNTVSDAFIWKTFMTRGRFFLPRPTGEYDTYISSGYFPIEPGERQRMTVSVAMAGGGQTKAADVNSAKQKQAQAQIAYGVDYRFAKAPIPPNVRVVPGDRKVTLYWDDIAEFSKDEFIKGLGGPENDFEGYRIYRATDAAFLDSKVITNAKGEKLLNLPIAQFDLDDGIQGYHPIDIVEGVKFYLGEDTGLQYSFTDSNLVNGQRYFYAVTSYDFGYEVADVAPSECSIKVNVDSDGNVTTGTNVIVVRPRAAVAGYLPAEVVDFQHVSGTSAGLVNIEIIDPKAIKDGNTYELTFTDTLFYDPQAKADVLRTKDFTFRNVTSNDTLIKESKFFNAGDDQPIKEGFRLHLANEGRVAIDRVNTKWSNKDVYNYQFSQVVFIGPLGQLRPSDYQIIIGEPGIATSKDTSLFYPPIFTYPLPSKAVNFKVVNVSEQKEIQFAFDEKHGNDGNFSIDPMDADKTDTIFLLEEDTQGKLVYTWQILLNIDTGIRNPQAGDTLFVFLRKPFLSTDVYRFQMRTERESKELAKQQLNDIRVVPNPYIAAEVWEPRNPYSSGRGPRELHFINLPRKCTIRVFNVSGVMIDKIEHNSTLDNGTAIWDMLSRDNLSIAYGVYVYHIDAPGIGEKTGTFAIIK